MPHSIKPYSIKRKAGLASLGAALLAVAVAVVPGVANAAPVADTASAYGYYTVQHLCSAPQPGHAACDAMRRLRVSRMTPGAHRIPLATVPAGPSGGYTPADLAKAYGVNSSARTTQTVAIVDANDDPNALSDLNTFNAQYGLPAETATSFRKVNQNGATTPLPAADSGWAGEISLDLDAVRGLCHNCKIILIEANSSGFNDLATAENTAYAMGARIISNSYGGAESGAVPSSVVAAYNHPRTVITASTGDDGFFDWDNFNEGGASSNAPELPSSLNTVVAVGGTTLYLNDDSTRSSETVWNENGPSDLAGYNMSSALGASGGGCSTVINAARWQRTATDYNRTTCGTKRLAADIAALADPYTGYDIYDSYASSGWQTYGGTSLAAPLIAAMWGLAGGARGVTHPSLSLYGHYKSSPSSLYDVTAGGNGACNGVSPGQCASFWGGSPNTAGAGTLDCAWLAGSSTLAPYTRECDAAVGLDGPSGVGTPKGTEVFKPMAPTGAITAPATVTHGASATFSGSGSTDPFPGGTITSYRWDWGDGSAASSGVTAHHTYAAAGSRTVTLTVTDIYKSTDTVTKTITVH